MDHIQANEFMDLYGCLLTGRQLEILKLYYQEDFSLSEIQEELEISKAAVSDALRKGVKAMEKYEGLLHLAEKNRMLSALAAKYPETALELEQIQKL
ncbi:MAG: DNA-binding protein [Erysipelotrichaceae bacterium]|nr:DNA-binding protein [Erysipelotrichaceae bacterium]